MEFLRADFQNLSHKIEGLLANLDIQIMQSKQIEELCKKRSTIRKTTEQ